MVEITYEEQNKVKKNAKNWGKSQRPRGQYQKHQHWIIGVQEKEKKKWYEKIFEEVIVENSPNMENEIVN